MNKVLVIGVMLIIGFVGMFFVFTNTEMMPIDRFTPVDETPVDETPVDEWTQGKMWKLLESDNVTMEIILLNNTLELCYYDREDKTVNVSCNVNENGHEIYDEMKINSSDVVFSMNIEPMLNDVYNVDVVVWRDYVVYNEVYPLVYNNTNEHWSW